MKKKTRQQSKLGEIEKGMEIQAIFCFDCVFHFINALTTARALSCFKSRYVCPTPTKTIG